MEKHLKPSKQISVCHPRKANLIPSACEAKEVGMTAVVS